jgi:large subunit ribosomal protein L1
MGKIRTVTIGDETAEEAARLASRQARRARKEAEVKRAEKQSDKSQPVTSQPVSKTDKPRTGKPETENPASPAGGRKPKTENRHLFPRGRKYRQAVSLVDRSKLYSPDEAAVLVKKTSLARFGGSVEVHINCFQKGLRGTLSLPHGTGKQAKIRVADDALVSALEQKGAGAIDFDVLVATPAMMPKLAKVAKILGPRGLMPNPKTNTISEKPEELAKTLSSSFQWKTEADCPIVHTVIGRTDFTEKQLAENLTALVKSIGRDKIAAVFIKPTMGPSLKVAF